MPHRACLFCNLPKQRVVLENETTLAFFDSFPIRIVNWAYQQTFENSGLTWLRADELRNLPLNWHDSLTAFEFN